MKLPISLSLLLCILSGIFLSACQQESGTASTEESRSETEIVLVRVNGEPITDVDLSVTTEKLFSRSAAGFFSQEIEDKALESMVMMMAIAQAAEREVETEELDKIAARVRRYREELLVEVYLRKHGNVTPPTQTEIMDFYEDNKPLFGEKPVMHFAMVRTKAKPASAELQNTLQQMQAIMKKDNWVDLGKRLKQQNSPLEYITATTDVPNLNKDLLRVVNALDQGELSNITYIDGKPHVIKLLKETKKNARPLAEVSNSIRRTLAAKKLKQQVKILSDQLLATAEVAYINNEK